MYCVPPLNRSNPRPSMGVGLFILVEGMGNGHHLCTTRSGLHRPYSLLLRPSVPCAKKGGGVSVRIAAVATGVRHTPSPFPHSLDLKPAHAPLQKRKSEPKKRSYSHSQCTRRCPMMPLAPCPLVPLTVASPPKGGGERSRKTRRHGICAEEQKWMYRMGRMMLALLGRPPMHARPLPPHPSVLRHILKSFEPPRVSLKEKGGRGNRWGKKGRTYPRKAHLAWWRPGCVSLGRTDGRADGRCLRIPHPSSARGGTCPLPPSPCSIASWLLHPRRRGGT